MGDCAVEKKTHKTAKQLILKFYLAEFFGF